MKKGSKRQAGGRPQTRPREAKTRKAPVTAEPTHLSTADLYALVAMMDRARAAASRTGVRGLPVDSTVIAQ